MTTYKKCDSSVAEMANDILCKFPSHKPVLDAKVRIDFMFAIPPTNADGVVMGDAIRVRGRKALGMCRTVKLKDRAKGMGDVEITIDQDWWESATEAEQQALLDHELTHIQPRTNKTGSSFLTDDLNRPLVKMRQHDIELGLFNDVAERHGENSLERKAAKLMFDNVGQLYWPEFVEVAK